MTNIVRLQYHNIVNDDLDLSDKSGYIKFYKKYLPEGRKAF